MRRRLTTWIGILALSGLTGCFMNLGGISELTRVQPFEETVVLGEKGPKVVLVEIDGVISAAERRSAFGLRSPSMVAELREALDLAAEDEDVAGILLRINSPGGTVSASETLHHELKLWKSDTGKPIVAYLQGLATSGGYYAAVAADRIVAHPTTVTGSIGVVMRSVNVTGLMEKLGVEDQTFTSGAFKDTGSPTRKMRSDEREQLASVITDLHSRFREVVVEGRPGLEATRINELADGRVYTANQALEHGLIDEIGHVEEAVAAIELLAGLKESRLVAYHRSGDYKSNVYNQPQLPAIQMINIDLIPFARDYMSPGFYYLWPAAIH